jgi:hypothetical protein
MWPVYNGKVHARRALGDNNHMLYAAVMRCDQLLGVVHLPVQATPETASSAALQVIGSNAAAAAAHEDEQVGFEKLRMMG